MSSHTAPFYGIPSLVAKQKAAVDLSVFGPSYVHVVERFSKGTLRLWGQLTGGVALLVSEVSVSAIAYIAPLIGEHQPSRHEVGVELLVHETRYPLWLRDGDPIRTNMERLVVDGWVLIGGEFVFRGHAVTLVPGGVIVWE